MLVEQLLNQIRSAPDSVDFNDVMATIGEHYDYRPTRFSNGLGDDVVINEAGQNEGSCKLFAFARLNGLDEQQTLACFGHYYREDVLGHPEASDHGNIRSFMRHGWAGIQFDQDALTPR